MEIERRAYLEAIEVLKKCATAHGFFAAYPGYDAVWARDSMIISLGASIIKGSLFKRAFAQSINTLSKKQSKLGQIPNAVDTFSRRTPHVDYGSIDSTLWFIIGTFKYQKRYKDSAFIKQYNSQIKKASRWLRYQDFGENGMLVQPPTTDWQDSFPHRYGYTINTQALYYHVLTLLKKSKDAKRLRDIANHKHGLWTGEYYLPWKWKDHNSFHERGTWFDSLGNLLAIIFGLADEDHAKKILAYIKKEKIDQPYPMKAIYPPIRKGSKNWQDYFADCDAKKPYNYLNGGIWTFIGGFYILALLKYNKISEARLQLKQLAKANLQGKSQFDEWLHGKSGKPNGGKNQGWNAALYVLAYESVKQKKSLL
jgi:glycogen debranching enzyme